MEKLTQMRLPEAGFSRLEEVDFRTSDIYHGIYIWDSTPMAKSPKKRHSQAANSRPAEAKVFMSGRSQAVRLPLEFRVTGRSVFIKRLGDAIVLLPKTGDRLAAAFAALDEFPRDFTLNRRQRQLNRRGLKDLFGNNAG